MNTRNKILAIGLSFAFSAPALAGRGFTYSQIDSAIRSDNGDVIIAELERAERFACSRCVEPVMALLDHDDYRVREVAAWWFSKRPAQAAEVHDLSVARLAGSNGTLARNAADALGTLRNPKALPALQTAALKTAFPAEARMAAVRALGTIGHPHGETTVLQAMSDASADVRLAALHAHHAIRKTTRKADVSILLSDASEEVRRKAAAIVGEYKVTQTRVQLEAMLSDSDFLVRRNAAWALGRLGDRSSRQALEAATNDSNSLVSSVAQAAIRKLR